MISFELTPEQLAWQSKAREFAEKELRDYGWQLDNDPSPHHRFDRGMIRKMGREGFLSLLIPEEYGGQGLDMLTAAIVIEELAVGDAGMAFSASNNSAPAVLLAGSEEQKRRWLPLCGDPEDSQLMGFCLTEADAGSDAAGVRTVARLDGAEWVIDGRKCFISNGGVCGLYAVFASIDRSRGTRGITAFLVPGDAPGLSVGKMEDKMGMRTCVAADVIFENVRIPRDNLLGEEGRGFGIAMKALEIYRTWSAGTIGVGLARGAFEVARRFSRERVAFDRSGFEKQAVSFKLAEMAAAVEAARLVVWKACWLGDSGKPFTAESAMAKFVGSDTAVRVCTDALGILGLEAYSPAYPVEKMLRDAKLLQIYEGTNQIARMVVARQVIGG